MECARGEHGILRQMFNESVLVPDSKHENKLSAVSLRTKMKPGRPQTGP